MSFDSNFFFQIYLPNLCYISLQNNNLQYLPNIPFYSEPTILIRNNDLTYLSYSFARYLKRKHVPPIEQSSDWNLHCARYLDSTQIPTSPLSTVLISLKIADLTPGTSYTTTQSSTANPITLISFLYDTFSRPPLTPLHHYTKSPYE